MARVTDAILCVLAVALIALGAREVAPFLHSLEAGAHGPVASTVARTISRSAPFAGRDRVTVLLLGADKRSGDAGRSDTLLILFVNPRTRQSALLGIPRDLYVAIPGYGKAKVNHAYAHGGPELARRTLEGALDVGIDYYALCFFSGFVEAVDALGGVDLNVPDVEGQGRGMNYDDNAGDLHIHLSPGLQRLSGDQALGFVRYRQSNTPGLGDGDVGRSGRQQELLKAIVQQHLRVRSLPRAMEAARALAANIETDMQPAELADLARALHGTDPTRMLNATVPLRPSNWRPGRAYYAYADAARLGELMAGIEGHLAGVEGSRRVPIR